MLGKLGSMISEGRILFGQERSFRITPRIRGRCIQVCEFRSSILIDLNSFVVDDERHDLSLKKLIDIRLYDRWGDMVRSTPEERAMRYSAVCTSMLADRVEDLEEGNESSCKKIAEVEGSMGALEVQQAKLNNKVSLLEWDFNLNLKYWSQVVNFEAHTEKSERTSSTHRGQF